MAESIGTGIPEGITTVNCNLVEEAERKTEKNVQRKSGSEDGSCPSTGRDSAVPMQLVHQKNAGRRWKSRRQRKLSHLNIIMEPSITAVLYASGKSYQR